MRDGLTRLLGSLLPLRVRLEVFEPASKDLAIQFLMQPGGCVWLLRSLMWSVCLVLLFLDCVRFVPAALFARLRDGSIPTPPNPLDERSSCRCFCTTFGMQYVFYDANRHSSVPPC
jgi:hypothetical protein